MSVTPLDIAKRFIGAVQEIPGAHHHHPFIQWAFSLCGMGLETPDEVAWCSAFVQVPAFVLGLPRSRSARARSWLQVGWPVALLDARPGFDVVVLKRGGGNQPGPEVIQAAGHVGMFAGRSGELVLVCGGNQSDAVTIAAFPASRVLGVRRLAEAA